jgi:6,7-dimethyl-8-ribityllumazine synthase
VSETFPQPAPAPEPEPELQHAPGELTLPPGYEVVEGAPEGKGRSVAVVVSRFNGEISSGLLERALDALTAQGVAQTAITVIPVPGAFELPLAAMALARSRRFACIVALGCVIRGETPHFEYVAGEAASGLQLAGLETGVPVSFGVLTCNTREQAQARLDKGAEAARSALEMADLFGQLRGSQTAASAPG